MTFSSGIKAAIDAMTNILTDAGYTVIGQAELITGNQSEVMAVVMTSFYSDGEPELFTGSLSLEIHYRHTYGTDSELMAKLEEIETLFDDYVLGGEAKGCTLSGIDNYPFNDQHTESVAVLKFSVMI